MREVLDRLREATTAIDHELIEVYYAEHTPGRAKALGLLLTAKQNVWLAQMQALEANASGHVTKED